MKNERSDFKRNLYMLSGQLKKNGFDCWRHSFSGRDQLTGEERIFFIDFFIINPALTPDRVVLGLHPDTLRDKLRPSYVLVKAGVLGKNARQIHNFYPARELKRKNGILDLQAGSCRLTDDSFIGSVSVGAEEAAQYPECLSDAGIMRWNLDIDKAGCIAVKSSSLRYRFFRTFPLYWHISGANTQYSGTVMFDGREYAVIPEKSAGYAEKIWGSSFDSPWLRVHCNNLYSQFSSRQLEKSSLIIGSCMPRRFTPSKQQPLQIFLDHEGILYEFSFLKQSDSRNISFFYSEDGDFCNSSFSAGNRKFVLDINLQCKKSTMIDLLYEQPDGKKTANLRSSADGSGEIKLYQKHGKILEALEHITFAGAVFEYGNSAEPV